MFEKRFLASFNKKLESRLIEQKSELEKFFKDQMDEERLQFQKENEDLSEQIKSFDLTNEEKNNEITRLEKKSEVLADEIATLEEELDKKNKELKDFSKKTDEYLRWGELRAKIIHIIIAQLYISPRVYFFEMNSQRGNSNWKFDFSTFGFQEKSGI